MTPRLQLSRYKKLKFSLLLRWPFLSIILLGILSNSLVNYVLDLKYQRPPLSMSLEEYINALIAAWMLLGGTRVISKKLDAKLPWTKGPVKRLLIQMLLHLLYIVVLFNAVLIGITYFFYGGFYELGDILIIDICTVAMSFLFSAFDSAMAFFTNWRKAAAAPQVVLTDTAKTIEVSLGKARHLIKVADVVFAYSEEGLVYLQTRGQRLVTTQSLDALMEQLDSGFFRANRQVILSRQVVKNYSSLPQGKIKVSYGLEVLRNLTVSRTKAAAFRQWMKAGMEAQLTA